MFLSSEERKEIMVAYGFEDFIEANHYKVGPDTWIYLFEHENKKYILVVTDYLGDFEFDTFPHLLKFESYRLGFVLQNEVQLEDDSILKKIHANIVLFEYT